MFFSAVPVTSKSIVSVCFLSRENKKGSSDICKPNPQSSSLPSSLHEAQGFIPSFQLSTIIVYHFLYVRSWYKSANLNVIGNVPLHFECISSFCHNKITTTFIINMDCSKIYFIKMHDEQHIRITINIVRKLYNYKTEVLQMKICLTCSKLYFDHRLCM